MDEESVKKTGTTTVGLNCGDGLVLCADKRVTAGYLIANKKFQKIMQLSDNIITTVAGTVSDVQLLVRLMRAEIKLKEIHTSRTILVREAVSLLANLVFNNIRRFSIIPGLTHFIVGGKDQYGFLLVDVGADGSTTTIDDYTSSGSGSVMAYGVLETLYRPGLSVAEAIKIGAKAINAAVQRDIATGNGIDIMTVTKEGVKLHLTKEIDMNLHI